MTAFIEKPDEKADASDEDGKAAGADEDGKAAPTDEDDSKHPDHQEKYKQLTTGGAAPEWMHNRTSSEGEEDVTKNYEDGWDHSVYTYATTRMITGVALLCVLCHGHFSRKKSSRVRRLAVKAEVALALATYFEASARHMMDERYDLGQPLGKFWNDRN